ncbi:MAG: methyltransferase domain-containing protein [Clostridia bacterium]|nr:methyltransferase domain-containing protein [Clostridia bacterium]
MENYIKGNKEAWEEAFEKRHSEYGKNIKERMEKEFDFLEKDMITAIKKYDLKDKVIAQFCSNNGAELLSVVKHTKAKFGIGFDIAENQVEFSNQKAKELNIPCEFVAKNILDIKDEYNQMFDFVFITIGALNWFKDLNEFFKIISKTMKKDGIIIINEQHPFLNMLARDDEKNFNQDFPLNPCYSYFSKTWTFDNGMYYMTKKVYKSKTFTDFTHSLGEIINAMIKNNLCLLSFKEFDYDVSYAFLYANGKNFPLSYVLEAKKL